MYTLHQLPEHAPTPAITPPAIPDVRFLSLICRTAVPRGYLASWFVAIDSTLACRLDSPSVSDLFDAHDIIDCESCTPESPEPLDATHVITYRIYRS